MQSRKRAPTRAEKGKGKAPAPKQPRLALPSKVNCRAGKECLNKMGQFLAWTKECEERAAQGLPPNPKPPAPTTGKQVRMVTALRKGRKGFRKCGHWFCPWTKKAISDAVCAEAGCTSTTITCVERVHRCDGRGTYFLSELLLQARQEGLALEADEGPAVSGEVVSAQDLTNVSPADETHVL